MPEVETTMSMGRVRPIHRSWREHTWREDGSCTCGKTNWHLSRKWQTRKLGEWRSTPPRQRTKGGMMHFCDIHYRQDGRRTVAAAFLVRHETGLGNGDAACDQHLAE